MLSTSFTRSHSSPHLFKPCGGPVGRCIVNRDQLPIRVACHPQQALDAKLRQLQLPVANDHDADFREASSDAGLQLFRPIVP